MVVSGVSNLPTFYIDNRKTDGSIVTVTALDRMAFADNETFPYDSLDGTGEKVQLSAESALMPYGTVPYIGLLATFAQTGAQYLINVVTAKITRNGVVCSLSTSDPNTSEIGLQGKLTKAVQNRVEYNKKSGCTIYTKYQGTVYVDEEES